MNQHLEKILACIESLESITEDQRTTLAKALKDADTELSITAFKLERTEKVKRTTAILLEETIQELEHKRQAVESSNKALEQSLHDLKAAQDQLVHSEKMASLGELTAGIAHEIQNPLNFVNNFSEVSTELVTEMNEALANGNIDEATLIATDLKENLEKINHHGKRAGEIVKSMLQHSRTGSGQKEPADINALVDEYLRLAYHGFRAKDKTFNAMMKTDLDKNLPKIPVIPQEIGRVVLNLITNAFYVVNEKSKALNDGGNTKYDPVVSVRTVKHDDKIQVSVTDNGNGIPQHLVSKIFQPFFSTKPTGKGTGLGLSLSYDIVTKAHNGTLEVETYEGEGSTFHIFLPI